MDEIIDYARPTLLAERALRDLHNAVIEKRYDEAKDYGMEAMRQTMFAYLAIAKEQRDVRKASTGA
jgi:hypothetical protein